MHSNKKLANGEHIYHYIEFKTWVLFCSFQSCPFLMKTF